MYLSQYFVEAKSDIAEYEGWKIYQGYTYDLKGKHKIKIKILSSKKDAERALLFYIYNFKGDIYNNQGQKCVKPRGVYASVDFWERDWWKDNKEFILDIDLKEGYIYPKW